MKKGNRVYLDTIMQSDLEQLRAWRNHEPFKRNFREFREISESMQEKWMSNIVNNNPNHLMFAIRDTITSKLIGCTGLTYINWVYKNADLSIYIGDKFSYINDERADETLSLLLDYGFNQLNLHRIWTEIYSFDDQKKDFFSRMNFSIDGRLRDNYYYDGKYWDSIIFSLLSSEFNNIKVKN